MSFNSELNNDDIVGLLCHFKNILFKSQKIRPQFNPTSDLDGTWFYIGAYLTSGKRNDVTSQILGLAMLEVKF